MHASTSPLPLLLDAVLQSAAANFTSDSTPAPPAVQPAAGAASSILHMRLALTVTHLLLVSLGSVNLLVIIVILVRPYMRSITNVYMISLCLADFIYLANLTLVAATQINDKSWPFSSALCTIYHGTETTGKYASVMFVVLLAVDRYCAMCKSNWCARYRNYRTAVLISLAAWLFAALAASPLFYFAEVALLRLRGPPGPAGAPAAAEMPQMHRLCIAKWPNSDIARWYITISSVLIFALPLAVIIFCYYHILNKLREALKSCKRLKRGASSRAPYHRVTRLVLWVVVFHVLSWSPFWLFNLFSSIFRLRISTQFDRIVINIVHLFPYVNCALNPILYVAHAENFRAAFRSLFCGKLCGGTRGTGDQRELYGAEDSRAAVGPTLVTGGSSVLIGSTSAANGGAHRHAMPSYRTLHGSNSAERPLLGNENAEQPRRTLCARSSNHGSAPSLLLECPRPLRANSAKHSVITLLDQFSGVEQADGTSCAACSEAPTMRAARDPFVSRVISAAEAAPKRSNVETCLLLEEINAAEQLGDDDAEAEEEGGNKLCLSVAGIVAGTLMGSGGGALGQNQTEEDGDEFV